MKRSAPQDYDAKRAAVNNGPVFAFKFLVPERFGRGLIGKGGSVLAQLKEIACGEVKVSSGGDLFPGAAPYPHRQIVIAGASPETTNAAFSRALARMGEMAEKGWSEMGAAGGSIQFQVILPRGVASRVIGKGGATSVQLRQTFGVKLAVQSSRAPEQIVVVTGPVENIEPLCAEFVTYIAEDAAVSPTYCGLTVVGGGAGAVNVAHGGKGGAPGLAYGNSFGAGPAGTEAWQAACQTAPHVLGAKTEITIQVPDDLVSKVIGRSGAVIRELQQRTGVFCRIDTNAPAGTKPLLLSGTVIGVQAAHVWVMAIIADGANAPPSGGKGKGKGKGRREL